MAADHAVLRDAHGALVTELATKHSRTELASRRALSFGNLLHQPEARVMRPGAEVPAGPLPDDGALAARVQDAFRAAAMSPLGDTGSFWLGAFSEMKRRENETLYSGEQLAVAGMLRDPATSMLMHGFDTLTTENGKLGDPEFTACQAGLAYDGLLRLGEAVGVVPMFYPEAPLADHRPPPDVEALLIMLDEALGFRIDFPNPFRGEIGLPTSRGIVSYRPIQALYQAWRIASLLDDRAHSHVVEIGPGLGRTAYYARRLGIGRYTLVDIPLSGAAQGYFLGRVLGEDEVSLFGETASNPVTIGPPTIFFDGTDRYDLVVNVDSLTEMAQPTAEAYLRHAAGCAPRLLSINHEFNAFRLRDFCAVVPSAELVSRTPYWLRRGYAEELVRFT
jgi:hypothetical protein